jgi:hypothetical protein
VLSSCASEQTFYPSPDAVLGIYREVGLLNRPATLAIAKLEVKVTKNSFGTFKYMHGIYAGFGLGPNLVAGYFNYSSPVITADVTYPQNIATTLFFPGNHTSEDTSTFSGRFFYDSTGIVNLELGNSVQNGFLMFTRHFIKIQQPKTFFR